MSSNDHLLKRSETAEALAVSVRTVDKFINEGRLPSVRLGRAIRISRADLAAFVASRTVKAR